MHLDPTTGNVANATEYFAGDNELMGVGSTKTDALFNGGTGLAASPAVAIGSAANEPLTEVFRLTNSNGENVFQCFC